MQKKGKKFIQTKGAIRAVMPNTCPDRGVEDQKIEVAADEVDVVAVADIVDSG